MKEAGIHFVARPNTAGHPTFTTVEGILSPGSPGRGVPGRGSTTKGEAKAVPGATGYISIIFCC